MYKIKWGMFWSGVWFQKGKVLDFYDIRDWMDDCYFRLKLRYEREE